MVPTWACCCVLWRASPGPSKFKFGGFGHTLHRHLKGKVLAIRCVIHGNLHEPLVCTIFFFQRVCFRRCVPGLLRGHLYARPRNNEPCHNMPQYQKSLAQKEPRPSQSCCFCCFVLCTPVVVVWPPCSSKMAWQTSSSSISGLPRGVDSLRAPRGGRGAGS